MPKSISLGDEAVTDISKPYIIAEIGLNHNRDLNLARKMIDAARKSFVNAVKFQTYITEKLVAGNSPAFKLFKDLELSADDFREIADYCRAMKIVFFSTPFCFEAVDILEKLDVPFYKIASMDTNYYELLKYIASTKKPVILSTGMTGMDTIERAIEAINMAGNDNIILLHTISKYPPKYDDMDMGMIERLKILFNYPVGFSDHTRDNSMAIVARTLGASVFEKHFTLDRNLPGPDHAISSTPEDFIDLKNKLDMVDRSMAGHIKRSDIEIENGARRSLYAGKDITKGETITREMIDVIRPFNGGLRPEDIELLIGKVIKLNMKKGEMFNLSCV